MAKTPRDPVFSWMPKEDRQADVRWLLKFLKTDLKTLAPGALADLHGEVLGFPHRGFRGPLNHDGEFHVRRRHTQRAQGLVSDGVASLRRGDTWVIRVPGEWKLTEEKGQLRRVYVGDMLRAFAARAADVLSEYWPRMRTCARRGCSQFFLPVQKQIYCSPDCSRQVHWANFKKANPGRKRDYRAEYTTRRKRELGQNVVVGRKKR